jgi:membrane protein implicated in regulation of membrane protease activity
MEPLFEHVSFWWAVGIGLLLMTGEMFAPSTLFLWTGGSCLLVAIPLGLFPGFNLLSALGLWLFLSIASILAARRYHVGHPASGDQVAPVLPPNRYGGEFVGLTTVLGADSENGQTRASLRGANWGIKLPGGDLKAGDKVRITAVEGIYLVGEKVTD